MEVTMLELRLKHYQQQLKKAESNNNKAEMKQFRKLIHQVWCQLAGLS